MTAEAFLMWELSGIYSHQNSRGFCFLWTLLQIKTCSL